MKPPDIWQGVVRKRAKGRDYYYWKLSKPWVRLPDPTTEADKFMRKLAHLQRVNEHLAETKAGTVPDTVRLYRKSPAFTGMKPNSQKLYGIYLDQLADIFPTAALTEIKPSHVQRYIMDENAEKPGAANMMLRVMHILYKWAGKRREGLKDPTIGIEEYEGGEHQPWPEHVLEAALASDDAQFRLAVALHLYTGQRTGDVCRMTWNVITADRRIPVRQEKTDKPLMIPIHADLERELSTVARTTLTILSNRQGQPLRPATLRGWVNAFAEKHGVKLVPHGLRKNAVNMLLEAGCSVGEVASITGQTLGIVEHYAKGRNNDRMAVVAMGRWSKKA